MVEEPRPTKKVVKKVVKKTVVRPAAATSKPAPRGALRTAPRPSARRPPTQPSRPRPARTPRVGLSTRLGTMRDRLGDVRHGVGDRFLDGVDHLRDVGDSARGGAGRGFDRVRAVRLPHLSPLRAALITGLLVGLVVVGLGWLSATIFTATRGTANGGAWGVLALFVVAIVAFVLGDLLLAGFGVDESRLISFTAVVLVLVLILAFFLGVAEGRAALILLPVLAMVSYAGSWRLLDLVLNDQPNAS